MAWRDRFSASWASPRQLGARIAVAVTAVTVVAVPFCLLLVFVETRWGPLLELDDSARDGLHGYALAHPLFVTLMRLASDSGSAVAWQVVTVLLAGFLPCRHHYQSCGEGAGRTLGSVGACLAVSCTADTMRVTIQNLQADLRNFARERDWEQYHNPKNLVMALVGEVGELTEIFHWVTPAEALELMSQDETAPKVRHELADVFGYLLRLADVLGVDLAAALQEKISVNSDRYPVHLSRGNARKYTDLGL